MGIAVHDRFETAREYIRAHNNPYFDAAATEALELILIKRHGVWRVRKTAPQWCRVPDGGMRARLAWEAYRVAGHAARWGDLSAWRDGLTGLLMFAQEGDRAFFDHVFDQFLAAAKWARASAAERRAMAAIRAANADQSITEGV